MTIVLTWTDRKCGEDQHMERVSSITPPTMNEYLAPPTQLELANHSVVALYLSHACSYTHVKTQKFYFVWRSSIPSYSIAKNIYWIVIYNTSVPLGKASCLKFYFKNIAFCIIACISILIYLRKLWSLNEIFYRLVHLTLTLIRTLGELCPMDLMLWYVTNVFHCLIYVVILFGFSALELISFSFYLPSIQWNIYKISFSSS